jgi:hypothetical protein
MRKYLSIMFLLLSLSAHGAQSAFFTATDVAITTTTSKVSVKSPEYSLQVVLSGSTFNVDVKLQTSIDEVNWVDITDASSASISSATSIMFDVTAGRHKFVRVVITRNSGTYSASGYLSNGGAW